MKYLLIYLLVFTYLSFSAKGSEDLVFESYNITSESCKRIIRKVWFSYLPITSFEFEAMVKHINNNYYIKNRKLFNPDPYFNRDKYYRKSRGLALLILTQERISVVLKEWCFDEKSYSIMLQKHNYDEFELSIDYFMTIYHEVLDRISKAKNSNNSVSLFVFTQIRVWLAVLRRLF